MTRICATFTLELEITDRDLLFATAKAHAIATCGRTEEEAAEMLSTEGAPDLDACIRMLLDPGISPDGLEIQDSACEHFEV